MGTIIPTDTINPLGQPIQTLQTATQTINGATNQMGDFIKFIETISGVLDKIALLRGSQPQQKGQIQQMPLIGSPQQQEAYKPQPQPQQTNEIQTKLIESETMQQKNISKEKIKNLIWDLLTIYADKLPQEIKEKQIGEVTGEKFKDFKFMFQGVFPINANIIVDTISKELAKRIPELYED